MRSIVGVILLGSAGEFTVDASLGALEDTPGFCEQESSRETLAIAIVLKTSS